MLVPQWEQEVLMKTQPTEGERRGKNGCWHVEE